MCPYNIQLTMLFPLYAQLTLYRYDPDKIPSLPIHQNMRQPLQEYNEGQHLVYDPQQQEMNCTERNSSTGNDVTNARQKLTPQPNHVSAKANTTKLVWASMGKYDRCMNM